MSWGLTDQPDIKTILTKPESNIDIPSCDKISNLNFNPTESCDIGPDSARQRRHKAFQTRQDAALFERDIPLPEHLCDGDELLYPNKIGNYSKALPHNKLGEVNINAYQAMIEALTTGNPEIFAEIPLGGVARLTNPQAAYAFEMTGPDSHHLSMIPAPAFSSAWNAGEMDELYWMALTRDVPFSGYASNPLAREAAAELTDFSDFRGPRIHGKVTPKTLFRIMAPGTQEGPYVSQFLYKDLPFGAATIPQRYRVPVAEQNFMTGYTEWLNIQNGNLPTVRINYDDVPRYIRNGRDLGEYVRLDFSYQAVLTACLILLSFGQDALASTNPYLDSPTQVGFVTFGPPHVLDFTAKAARVALEAAWFQKWLVHRRLRPEEFGANIHNLLTGAAFYPIYPELLVSQAVSRVFDMYGTYLLPQAYPEGCPTHPAYPAGHAALIGAAVTMLKAFFNELFVLPDPVIASPDGLSLLPYSGPPLTVGGELNKLAANICMGRNFAGIHWRSDNTESLKLGETVAIRILQDYRNTYNEDFISFSFTRFDGTTIII